MAFWLDIAAFALKALLIVAAVGGLAVLIARLARSGEAKDEEIKVRSLNERYDDMRDAMNGALLDKKERKALARDAQEGGQGRGQGAPWPEPGKRIYVLAFKGDMRASAVKRLGSEIDAVLIAARPGTDEAVIRIESPGGTVTGYGLAAAEILRLREHKIKVTASVDQVAASGGYMMACAADRIVAAPFASSARSASLRRSRTSIGCCRRTRSISRRSPPANSSAPSRCWARSRRRAASISAASSTRPTRRSSPCP